MYFKAHSLLAPIPLDDWDTSHLPKIPVSLKFHGGALSFCVGVMGPFRREFGSLGTNSPRGLVLLLGRDLVRLWEAVLKREKQPGHLPGPETDGKCKTPPEMPASVYGPMMNLGATAKVLADENGPPKRPLKLMDWNTPHPPLAPVESLPGPEPDPRITSPLIKHQKQGLNFMMVSKEKDRDYADSKWNPSPWRSFGHGGRALDGNFVPCDKTGARLGEVYGGILAGVMGLEKTPH
ncbi:hypothetical protein B9Z19DRAFT_1120377 [Tuber borchii]|uniref:Uncharacterized protein n=1 Tax=Tuber borchii TaxID=42251 RepID=A0A2T7A4H5_TUBBO|nr:hypothetical protein B9Z19DRAFT_1120377 [Tuber borchii]